jgi:hypothetical protein
METREDRRMSTEVAVVPPQPLTIQQRVIAVLGERDEAMLQKLADGTKDITTITNDDGYKQIHAARIVLKNERIAIEKDCKKAREDATAFSKAVIKEEDRLIGIISPEEKRLQKLQDAWDAEIERIRQEKIDVELKRVAGLQERVTELRGNLLLSATDGAALVAEHIADLERVTVDETYQEFQQQAADAKEAGLSRLRAVYTAAVAHEAEQAKIKVEREELARLREGEALRAAQEKARRDEEERAAKIARDAENARHAEQLRQQRDEQEAAAKAERMRLADEAAAARKLIDEEEARQAAARAEIARQQEEIRKAQEPPKPAPTRRGIAVTIPTASEIIDVLAKHYRAHPDTIIDWLQQSDFDQVKAA